MTVIFLSVVTSTPSPPSSPFPDPENRTQLLTPASSNQSSTPHLHLNPTPLHPAGTPGDVSTSAALPSTSVPQSDQGTPTVIPSFTPPSASEPPNATSAPRTSQPAASSTGFPQGASTTVTTPKPTRPEERPETSGVTRPATTAAAPTSTSTQAKPHTNGPSQLNVGGDSKCDIAAAGIFPKISTNWELTEPASLYKQCCSLFQAQFCPHM